MATARVGVKSTEYPVSLSPAQPADKKRPKSYTGAIVTQTSPATNKKAYAIGRWVGSIKAAQQKR